MWKTAPHPHILGHLHLLLHGTGLVARHHPHLHQLDGQAGRSGGGHMEDSPTFPDQPGQVWSGWQELVASLNIQTGNMCQFLPQDVVKNFPLMTPQERFLSTVKAVGEGRLVEQFDRLKEIQKIVDNSDNLMMTKESTLESIKTKMEGIKQKKQKMDNIEQVMVNKDL